MTCYVHKECFPGVLCGYCLNPLQVNSRKIHDEADVLEGLMGQQLFLAVLGLEAALQVRSSHYWMLLTDLA